MSLLQRPQEHPGSSSPTEQSTVGDLDALVAEQDRDGFERHAVLQKMRGERVAHAPHVKTRVC